MRVRTHVKQALGSSTGLRAILTPAPWWQTPNRLAAMKCRVPHVHDARAAPADGLGMRMA